MITASSLESPQGQLLRDMRAGASSTRGTGGQRDRTEAEKQQMPVWKAAVCFLCSFRRLLLAVSVRGGRSSPQPWCVGVCRQVDAWTMVVARLHHHGTCRLRAFGPSCPRFVGPWRAALDPYSSIQHPSKAAVLISIVALKCTLHQAGPVPFLAPPACS